MLYCVSLLHVGMALMSYRYCCYCYCCCCCCSYCYCLFYSYCHCYAVAVSATITTTATVTAAVTTLSSATVYVAAATAATATATNNLTANCYCCLLLPFPLLLLLPPLEQVLLEKHSALLEAAQETGRERVVTPLQAVKGLVAYLAMAAGALYALCAAVDEELAYHLGTDRVALVAAQVCAKTTFSLLSSLLLLLLLFLFPVIVVDVGGGSGGRCFCSWLLLFLIFLECFRELMVVPKGVTATIGSYSREEHTYCLSCCDNRVRYVFRTSVGNRDTLVKMHAFSALPLYLVSMRFPSAVANTPPLPFITSPYQLLPPLVRFG